MCYDPYMPSDPQKPGKSRKGRVQFRRNRSGRARIKDWSGKTREAEESARTESVVAKGDLSRRRTITHHVDEQPAEGLRRGVVITVRGLYAEVDDGERIWPCTVRRILRTRRIEERNPVTVGDRVHFRPAEPAQGVVQEGTIEHVEPRRGMLQRLAGRHVQTIAANVDQAVIVTSAADPLPKPHLVDRYIVAAHFGGMQPVIVMNKIDLEREQAIEGSRDGERDHGIEGSRNQGEERDEGTKGRRDEGETSPPPRGGLRGCGDAEADKDQSTIDNRQAAIPAHSWDNEDEEKTNGEEHIYESAASILDRYKALGYATLCTSANTGEGIAELRAILKDKSSAIAGQSGVGKSSLLNAVQPGLALRVGEVMEQSRKGRHTTTNAHLIGLDVGGYVVDTPGIRAFDVTIVPQGELEAYFVEFVDRVKDCKYSNCSHTQEAGCAIRAAVDRGEIHADRYLTYIELFEEAGARRTPY